MALRHRYPGPQAPRVGWPLWGVVGVIVAALVVFGWAWRQHVKWVHSCEALGGHVFDHTQYTATTYIDSNGRSHSGTSSNTTYYCLSSDGRLLDIE